MFGDVEYHSQAYQEDKRRQAEHQRLIRRALAVRNQGRPSVYRLALARVGRQMVAWGTALQAGYDQLQTAPPADPCIDAAARP